MKSYPEDQAVAWSEAANDLATWTLARLVNRADRHGRYRDDGGQFTGGVLTRAALEAHYRARRISEIVGVHTTAVVDGRCLSKWGCIDIDAHDEGVDGEANLRYALHLWTKLVALGFSPLLLESNGKGGYHLFVLFEAPTPTEAVYRFLRWLVVDYVEHGLPTPPETFPKQESVLHTEKQLGNWVRLPGRHHRRDHWSAMWDGEGWLSGQQAIQLLLAHTGDDPANIPAESIAAQPKIASLNWAPKRQPTTGHWTAEARAGAYLAKCAPAVAGQRGHDRTFLTACNVGPGFDLAPDVALGMLVSEYNPRCQPPWTEAELRHKVNGAYVANAHRLGWKLNEVRPERGARPRPTETPEELDARLARLPRTDLGNGRRLVERFGRNLRYCHPWGKWLVWDGGRFAEDVTGAARRRAYKTVQGILREAASIEDDKAQKEHIAWAMSSQSKRAVDAMLVQAASLDPIPVLPKQLDRDPWLLNCPNGTIDLRTGTLREHRREDLLTKLCPVPYDPDAEASHFLRVANRVFNADPALIGFWRRLCGYCLTGHVGEQVLPIAWGTGANGKSTLLTILLEMLGPDYAMKAPPNLLVAKRGERHPTELADLFGKRLAAAVETADGARINEVLIKELTGGDKIRARRMREDFWEFNPTHKLILATNHKPQVRGTDHAIWRRLRLIPFVVTIPESERDKALLDKLRAELPGFLRWCVAGCREWLSEGLAIPEAVSSATNEYQSEEDWLGDFLDECTEPSDFGGVKAGALYKRYVDWAESSGEKAVSQKTFGTMMTGRGFERTRSNGKLYKNLALRHEDASHLPMGNGTIEEDSRPDPHARTRMAGNRQKGSVEPSMVPEDSEGGEL